MAIPHLDKSDELLESEHIYGVGSTEAFNHDLGQLSHWQYCRGSGGLASHSNLAADNAGRKPFKPEKMAN
jgi:hypothetical protein